MKATEPALLNKLYLLLKRKVEYAVADARTGEKRVADAQRVLKELDEAVGAGESGISSEKLATLSPENITERLQRLRRALREFDDDDGPDEPAHLMSDAYASNTSIILLTIFGAAGIAGLAWMAFRYWDVAVPGKNGEHEPREAVVLVMVMLFGALGAFVHWTKSLSRYVGNRKLKRSWIVYYLLMPFEGAALAAILYLLLRVGALGPQTTTGNLNVIGMYSFAALVGLFSKHALEKLAEVFSTLFTGIKTRDSLDSAPKDEPGQDSEK